MLHRRAGHGRTARRRRKALVTQIVYVLRGYDWNPAKVLKRNRKTLRVWMHPPWLEPHELTVALDRVAEPDERVCIVWEYDGTGRGSYRVERVLYPEHRIPAHEVARQSCGPGRVTERRGAMSEGKA